MAGWSLEPVTPPSEPGTYQYPEEVTSPAGASGHRAGAQPWAALLLFPWIQIFGGGGAANPLIPWKPGRWMGPEPLTSSISQDNLALARYPAVAGELDVIPTRCLHCDVLQVPVVMEPVLALLDFDQLDVAQFFIHCHIVRINLRRRKGKSDGLGAPEPLHHPQFI